MVADLDGLKIANDTRGHEFGDSLIQAAARSSRLRPARRASSRGWAATRSACSSRSADVGAETLVAPGASLRSHRGIDGFPLSASLGGGGSPPEATLADAVRCADDRMYEHKRRSQRSRARLEATERHPFEHGAVPLFGGRLSERYLRE